MNEVNLEEVDKERILFNYQWFLSVPQYKYTEKYKENLDKALADNSIARTPRDYTLAEPVISYLNAEIIVPSPARRRYEYPVAVTKKNGRIYLIDFELFYEMRTAPKVARAILNDLKHNLGDPFNKALLLLDYCLIDVTDVIGEVGINYLLSMSLVEEDFVESFHANYDTMLQKIEYFKETLKGLNTNAKSE